MATKAAREALAEDVKACLAAWDIEGEVTVTPKGVKVKVIDMRVPEEHPGSFLPLMDMVLAPPATRANAIVKFPHKGSTRQVVIE